ncbi:unnamed protein product [Orchesella dallaii]|uniref:O-acyltransferase WSD1 C-terminal domain-containing protein n=1 Tax=Orchesella dallaii TaxID=48710 RepID=A0ABP1Q2X3_9HEXA
MSLLNLVLFVLKECGVILFGLLCLFLLIIFWILSLPIYLYRYLVCLCTKLFCKDTFGKPVTPLGNYFACEFLPSARKSPPRSTLIVTVVVDRPVSFESVKESIEATWLGRDAKKFPELKQYVDSWMGFLFWKNDHSFKLENHLQPKKIEGETDDELEENVCLFMEQLVNKTFHPKRSPWECFVVQNYRNTELQRDKTSTNVMTLLVFRFHHSLVDGYSILKVIIESMMGIPLSTASLTPVSLTNKKDSPSNLTKKIVTNFTLVFRIVYEICHFFALAFTGTTPWHVPLNKKKCGEHICRTKPIPVESIRNIKSKLGVSFTSVLMSCASAAASRSFQLHHAKPEQNCRGRTMPTSIPLPRPDHPDKLRNHVTTTCLKLPTDPDLESLERLYKVDKVLRDGKGLLPLILPFFIALLGSHLAMIVQQITKNRHVSTAFSNFPGPGIQLEWEKGRVLTSDFAGGALPGVAGVGFAILSFGDYLRIAITANSAVMERNQVKELITFFNDEIAILQELAMKQSGSVSQREVNTMV